MLFRARRGTGTHICVGAGSEQQQQASPFEAPAMPTEREAKAEERKRRMEEKKAKLAEMKARRSGGATPALPLPPALTRCARRPLKTNGACQWPRVGA